MYVPVGIPLEIRSQEWNTYIRARTTSVLRALGQCAPPRASTHPRVPRGLPARLATHALPPAMPRPRPAPCVPHAARDCACPRLVMTRRRACPCAAPPRTAARCRSAGARAPRRLAPRAHRARCHRLTPWARQLNASGGAEHRARCRRLSPWAHQLCRRCVADALRPARPSWAAWDGTTRCLRCAPRCVTAASV